MPKVNGLSPKQSLFVEYYLQTWNATDAARRAGYSEHTAYVIGWENLKKPEIKKALDDRISALSDENQSRMHRALDHFQATGRRIASGHTKKTGVVYLIREEHGAVKIGKTIEITRRFAMLNALLPYKIEILATLESRHIDQLESLLHSRYTHKRIRGEWFALSDTDIAAIIDEFGTPQ